jgi:branched-chain amino acid aminotransferase
MAAASEKWKKPWQADYLTMWSSVWGGFSLHPELWAIPPDDHMAHRGDGVFESLKCWKGRVYCLDEHLDRLKASAQALSLALPPELESIRDILAQAYRLGKEENLVIRISASRGPGSFTVNPYDCPRPELYVITTKLKLPSPRAYQEGISLITAPFPAKEEFAGIKSCDYLHNAMVKKAAVDSGVSYAASFDREGNLTECPTENVAVVTKAGELAAPPWSRILRGVTLGRAMAHGQDLVREGLIGSCGNRDIKKEEIMSQAAEVFLTTTSFSVLPVVRWDGNPIGDGRPGPVAQALKARLDKEQEEDGPYTFSLAGQA